MYIQSLSIIAIICYCLYSTFCYGFEDTVSKQEKGRTPYSVEVDDSDPTEKTDNGAHFTGKEKPVDKPAESADSSKKKELRGSVFVPSEKIPADQAVDFPTDI